MSFSISKQASCHFQTSSLTLPGILWSQWLTSNSSSLVLGLVAEQKIQTLC